MKLFKDKKIDKAESIEKKASLLLDSDAGKWPKQIIVNFLEQYPELTNAPIDMHWIKKDPIKGYGIGILTVFNGGIPVIIKEFKLEPLDVIFFEDKVLPFDEITVNELMSDQSAFLGATLSKDKLSLRIFGDDPQWSPVNDGPTIGGNSTIRPTKYASVKESFIEKISSIDSKDVENLIKEAQNNEKFKEILENSDILSKIAIRMENYDHKWVNLLNSAKIDRQLVTKDKYGNVFVKQAFSNIDKVYTTKITFDEEQKLDNIFNTEKISGLEIEKNAEKFEFEPHEQLKVGEKGRFIDENGNQTEDFTILGVEKVAMPKKFSIIPISAMNSLVVDSSGRYMVVNKEVPKPINSEMISNWIDENPDNHMVGVFYVNGKATNPFEIIKVIRNKAIPGEYKYKVVDKDTGEIYEYRVINGISDIEPDPGNVFYIPENAKFIPLNGKIPAFVGDLIQKMVTRAPMAMTSNRCYKVASLVELEPKEFIITDAVDKIEDNKVPLDAYFVKHYDKKAEYSAQDLSTHVVRRDNAGYYYLFGPEFDKYAELGHEIKNVKFSDIEWPLVHLGITEDEFNKVASLNKGSEIKLESKLEAPMSVETFVKAAQEQVVGDIKDINFDKFKQEIIKVATNYISDPGTVDAVLSLGLVNKFNIMEYLDLLPDYERVLGELSRLLVFSRLGASEIDPKNLAYLVHTLNKVIFQLKTLRSIVASTSSTKGVSKA